MPGSVAADYAASARCQTSQLKGALYRLCATIHDQAPVKPGRGNIYQSVRQPGVSFGDERPTERLVGLQGPGHCFDQPRVVMANAQIPVAADAIDELPAIAIPNHGSTRVNHLKVQAKTFEKANVRTADTQGIGICEMHGNGVATERYSNLGYLLHQYRRHVKVFRGSSLSIDQLIDTMDLL
jgi:hypothetical protein